MRRMRVLSTYLFRSQRLGPALLDEVQQAGIPQLELYCARSHFDYRSPQAIRELADWLDHHDLCVHSVHAPTSRELGVTRENSSPISVSDLERVRRLDAVDEIKRAIELAEAIPFRCAVLHLGAGRESQDPRRTEAAMSSLEHLCLFAKQRGVTIALENALGEYASPSALRQFITDTRLHDLRLCFDAGHAHLWEGVRPAFDAMRDLVVTTHLHDNSAERDDHLLPGQGTIDWDAAMAALATAEQELPMVLEIRETSPDAKPLPAVISAFERLERTAAALAHR
ncbi:MAG TPA: sugar phosphate isomerase/epimerase family protein [Candidatus Acidoferrales bacterium]|nr:sugar phosphate isomerase/epimerase family protein [Candidatus Acidoferrales bacterium]